MKVIGSNPLLSDERLLSNRSSSSHMTVSGTVAKTLVLFVVLIITAAVAWRLSTMNPAITTLLLAVGGIGAFIAAMIGAFSPKASVFLAPVYAIFKGLALGSISMIVDAQIPGIAGQALSLTLGVLLIMLGLYGSGIIRASNTIVKIVSIGFLAILLSYVVAFFIGPISYLHQNGSIGILFSLAIVVIAALSFVLDFDRIEKGEQYGAPKYMEWYSALSLLVTRVLLYINILRILSILGNRR